MFPSDWQTAWTLPLVRSMFCVVVAVYAVSRQNGMECFGNNQQHVGNVANDAVEVPR